MRSLSLLLRAGITGANNKLTGISAALQNLPCYAALFSHRLVGVGIGSQCNVGTAAGGSGEFALQLHGGWNLLSGLPRAPRPLWVRSVGGVWVLLSGMAIPILYKYTAYR
jgi:hypothetical protein